MEKPIIKVARRTEPFICKICKQEVNPNYGKPKITETEEVIIHGWDYGHEHKQAYIIEQDSKGKSIYIPVDTDVEVSE